MPHDFPLGVLRLDAALHSIGMTTLIALKTIASEFGDLVSIGPVFGIREPQFQMNGGRCRATALQGLLVMQFQENLFEVQIFNAHFR